MNWLNNAHIIHYFHSESEGSRRSTDLWYTSLVAHKERHARSIVKAFTWKLVATAMAFVVSYIYTKDAGTAMNTALTMFVAGIVAYYLHERLWNRISWGKE